VDLDSAGEYSNTVVLQADMKEQPATQAGKDLAVEQTNGFGGGGGAGGGT
jgi:hypothetical protein